MKSFTVVSDTVATSIKPCPNTRKEHCVWCNVISGHGRWILQSYYFQLDLLPKSSVKFWKFKINNPKNIIKIIFITYIILSIIKCSKS